MRFHLLTAAALFALAGCDDKAPADGTDEADTDTDTDADTETGDTAPPGPDYFEPDFVFFQYNLGIDVNGAIASVSLSDGTEIPPSIDVFYVADGWSYSYDDTDNYCIIEYAITSSAPYDFALTPAQYFGMDIAGGTLTSAYDGCSSRFDPATTMATAGDFWGSLEWTVGIIDLPAEYAQYFTDPTVILGAQFGQPGFTNETSTPYGYTPIYETDENLVLTLDGGGFLVNRAVADTVVNGTLVPGWYRPQTFFFSL
jgi:hypothetical protein